MVKADEFDQITEKLMKTADEISKAKRPAYTVGNVDVLHNFKSVAQRLGISPGQALAVYMTKHYDAIITALTKPELPQAEEITGRFADAINYLKMGYALIQEKEAQIKTTTEPAKGNKDVDLKDYFAKLMTERDSERQKENPWRQIIDHPWVGKATTTLAESDWRQGNNQAAIANDPAQTQALGEHMQRARQSEVVPGLADGVLPSPKEQYRQSAGGAPESPGYEEPSAFGGCSSLSKPGAPDTTVLLFALPRDTSPL